MSHEQEFLNSTIEGWRNVIRELIPGSASTSTTWKTSDEILSVLKHIGKVANANYLFFPRMGGLKLTGAVESMEEGCLDLLLGSSIATLKPSVLTLEVFPENLSESFFRLESMPLTPPHVYGSLASPCEELVRLPDGTYLSRNGWDDQFMSQDNGGNVIPFPPGSKVIFRFTEGVFVIFGSGSIYNQDSSTTDGRHSKMTAEEFRLYVTPTP